METLENKVAELEKIILEQQQQLSRVDKELSFVARMHMAESKAQELMCQIIARRVGDGKLTMDLAQTCSVLDEVLDSAEKERGVKLEAIVKRYETEENIRKSKEHAARKEREAKDALMGLLDALAKAASKN